MTRILHGKAVASVLTAMFCTCAAGISSADTLHVPSEYPTIQSAIDAAVNGDIVEIADGTYTGVGNKNLDFGGRAITVRGASGDPALCIIDCEDDGRGFYFRNSEGQESVIVGLTVQNGMHDYGGGVRCDTSSPSLIDCIFLMNSTSTQWDHYDGGGMFNDYNSHPTLTRCQFIANAAIHDAGGVFIGRDSSATFTDCVFESNTAGIDGGGVCYYDQGSDALFISCTFTGNSACDGAGLMAGGSDSSVLSGCQFLNNSATRYGGAISLHNNAQLTDCVFSDNTAGVGRYN